MSINVLSGIYGGIIDSHVARANLSENSQEIWIYDIDLKNGYIQKATGDIPDNRSRFCSGITWADDKTSYNL